MGLDLRILPQYDRDANFSHDLIDLHRDYNLFSLISNLESEKGREVPKEGIYSFIGEREEIEGTCYGTTVETPYGDMMKGVLSKDLKDVLSNYKTEDWKNKAFIAFLNELPDDLEIWLYWH